MEALWTVEARVWRLETQLKELAVERDRMLTMLDEEIDTLRHERQAMLRLAEKLGAMSKQRT